MDGEEAVVVFWPQQMTACLPLASMAQKKPESPNAAAMGPMDPNPDADPAKLRRKKGRREKNP